ncbi:MAG: hypothetical protein WBJ36_04855 [Tenuifilum sp.]|jgi:hypothetical protein|uniref:hypothetical protein n=1 Tax=Tenuifilum sp. TaxID=2760880 RepID=UPI003BD6D487
MKPKYKKILLAMVLTVLILATLFVIDYFAFNFIPVTKTIDWEIEEIMYGKYTGTVRYRKPNGKGKFIVTSGLGVGLSISAIGLTEDVIVLVY